MKNQDGLEIGSSVDFDTLNKIRSKARGKKNAINDGSAKEEAPASSTVSNPKPKSKKKA